MFSAMSTRKLIAQLTLFLGFVLVLLWQTGSRLAEPELRAEDGTVFFRDGFAGDWSALLKEHNGYHHLACRLVAQGASYCACEIQPGLYQAAALVALLGLGLLALRSLGGLKLGWPAAFILVLVPQDGTVVGHLADLPSLASLVLILILLGSEATSRWGRALVFLAFAVAALTGPYVVFFGPIAVALALWRRDRRQWLLLGIALVAAYLQARHLPGTRIPGPVVTEVSSYLQAIGARTLAPLWPYYRSGSGPLLTGLGGLFLGLAVVLAALALRARNWPSLSFLMAGLLALGATLWAYRSAPELLLENPRDRYSYVQQVLCFWSLLAFLRSLAGDLGRHLRFGLVLLLAMSAYGNWLERPAFVHVGGWERNCGLLHSGLPIVVPIEPSWPLDLEPKERSASWKEQSLSRVFGAGADFFGSGEPRLSQLRGHEAIALGTDAVLVLPGTALAPDGELLVSVLARSGLANRSDSLRFVVEELGPEGQRRELGALIIQPWRDYVRAKNWRLRPAGFDPAAQLVLRCESAKNGAWLQLWALATKRETLTEEAIPAK